MSSDGQTSWELEPGASIASGRRVLRGMGGGTRYEVFLVWDDDLYSLAVAKVLRPAYAQDDDALADLRREVGILESLSHPVLLRAFDVVFEGRYPHVLLEHLDGPTLRRLIKLHGPLALEQLLPLTLQVVAVLHYLHRREIVHLDVKPANIVMGVPPRLIDLSIARPVESAARLRGAVGTDAYMAPEQADAAARPGRVGAAADIWGLGATLYHAMAGSVPFPRPRGSGASDDLRVRFPQLVDEPAPLRGVRPELREIVLRMLAKAPEERPSAVDVALALDPLLDGVPGKPRLRWRRGR